MWLVSPRPTPKRLAYRTWAAIATTCPPAEAPHKRCALLQNGGNEPGVKPAALRARAQRAAPRAPRLEGARPRAADAPRIALEHANRARRRHEPLDDVLGP